MGRCHTFRSALRAVPLHCHMGIEMVQRAVSLLAALPAALIHALNLLVPPPGPLVLLSARNGDEAVDLYQSVSATCSPLHQALRGGSWAYLVGTALASSRRGSLVEDVRSGGDVAGRLLGVTAPVGARLGIQAGGSGVLIALRHVLGRRSIWRVLAVRRICRAGTCNGGIYRQSGVRLGLLLQGVVMAMPIVVQRHGRTCWCLRHTSAAPVRVARGVV